MPLIHQVLDLFLHLDKHLNGFATAHQIGVYGLLAIIIFCETGLVVWPFLPGDSLLFAVEPWRQRPVPPSACPG